MLGSWDQVLYDVFFAIAGIVVLSAALEGYALRRLTLVERILAFAAGFALVAPHPFLDKVGIALIALLGMLQLWQRLRRA